MGKMLQGQRKRAPVLPGVSGQVLISESVLKNHILNFPKCSLGFSASETSGGKLKGPGTPTQVSAGRVGEPAFLTCAPE